MMPTVSRKIGQDIQLHFTMGFQSYLARFVTWERPENDYNKNLLRSDPVENTLSGTHETAAFLEFPNISNWLDAQGGPNQVPLNVGCSLCDHLLDISASAGQQDLEETIVLECGHLTGKLCFARYSSMLIRRGDRLSCPTCHKILICSGCEQSLRPVELPSVKWCIENGEFNPLETLKQHVPVTGAERAKMDEPLCSKCFRNKVLERVCQSPAPYCYDEQKFELLCLRQCRDIIEMIYPPLSRQRFADDERSLLLARGMLLHEMTSGDFQELQKTHFLLQTIDWQAGYSLQTSQEFLKNKVRNSMEIVLDSVYDHHNWSVYTKEDEDFVPE
ncbi:hypothetical protein SUNI508_00125 [Seiridium unicorne]|uniref:RING-type domain-containing protein n=1 Tax=Seiridium unicorne TaxID=138068 RepID=A0ABR2VJ07_9PEZI